MTDEVRDLLREQGPQFLGAPWSRTLDRIIFLLESKGYISLADWEALKEAHDDER